MIEKLRQEILQSESVRSDLLKWKLALAGAIGAAGLGFAGSEGRGLDHADLVLCVIPPVCVYVDLLCMHLNLKMLVIGTFLSQWSGGDETRVLSVYESFVDEKARRLTQAEEVSWKPGAVVRRTLLGKKGKEQSAFELEDWALSLSTLALSLALIVYAIPVHSKFSIPFALSGVAGLVATAIGNAQFAWRFEAVRNLELETK